MVSRPDIKAIGDVYEYNFQEEKIKARMSRLRDTADGLKGEVELTTYREDEEPFIHYANINLLSTRSRKEISRYATSRVNSVDWDGILEYICDRTVQYYRQGEPVESVGNNEDDEAVEYTVYPTIIENEHNILYGYGGTGKSYFACLLALLIQSGESRAGFHAKQGNVLYLDFETQSRHVNRRLKELKKGLSLPSDLEITYRNCHIPVPDDIESIRQIVLERNISVIIIDSIGLACGLEPETADSALRFYRAQRSLEATVISITHKAKDGTDPFGSVFWWNNTRNIWEVNLGEQLERNKMVLSLKHAKTNLDFPFNDIGLEFQFHPDSRAVSVNNVDVKELPELLKNLPLKDQIKYTLLEYGEMTSEEIASELPADKNGRPVSAKTVRTTCSRYKTIFQRIGNKWSVKARMD